jgi:hypothetical protein
MRLEYISARDLQRSAKDLLQGKPIQIVLNYNKVSGILITGDMADRILNSNVLPQLLEEFEEGNDALTKALIKATRAGEGKPVDLAAFRKQYGL